MDHRRTTVAPFTLPPVLRDFIALVALWALAPLAWAGEQLYEPLSASVQSAMALQVDTAEPISLHFDNPREGYRWLIEMSERLAPRIPDLQTRVELLKAIHYEATRAGLDPQLVLGLIQVESGFRKYAISTAGARGLMQVMPFWMDLIGNVRHDLFHLRTNLRYGCTILRHYLDQEHGNLLRALARYNGSLGHRSDYPSLVVAAARQWQFPSSPAAPAARPVVAGAARPPLAAVTAASSAASTPAAAVPPQTPSAVASR